MLTVVVEQTFSMGGWILHETGSSMTLESVDAQAYLDDWTKAAKRKQEIISKENNIPFDLSIEGTIKIGMSGIDGDDY